MEAKMQNKVPAFSGARVTESFFSLARDVTTVTTAAAIMVSMSIALAGAAFAAPFALYGEGNKAFRTAKRD